MSAQTTFYAVVCTASLLTGCASLPDLFGRSALGTDTAYRCAQAEGFNVAFGTDSAVLTGPRGRQELLRDAGGLTSRQTVYSNADVRAEFGLGVDGREAVLRLAKPAAVLRCVQDPGTF